MHGVKLTGRRHKIGQGHGHVASHAMSSLYSLSFCVPPPLQQSYELFWCLKSYSFSGGMLDQSPCATGCIGWAMAWGKGLPDGVCGRALWGLQLRSDAVGLLRSSGAASSAVYAAMLTSQDLPKRQRAASMAPANVVHCSGGLAEAALRRRRYAVMKDAARARRR